MNEFISQYLEVLSSLSFLLCYSVLMLNIVCTSLNILFSEIMKKRNPELEDIFDLRIFIRRFWGSILTTLILGMFGVIQAMILIVSMFVILIAAYMLREIQMALQFTGIDLKYLGIFERKINKVIIKKLKTITSLSKND